MKFVDQLPADGRRRQRREPIDVAALRAEPGRWAEVDRLPKNRRQAIAGRGVYFVSRNEDTQYTVRAIGDEVVLFVRAVAR